VEPASEEKRERLAELSRCSPVYMGVDVGGKGNTWACALSERSSTGQRELFVFFGPKKATLEELVKLCWGWRVVACAIDAPLSYSLEEESGLRRCDQALRELLPPECRNWVMSLHSLMAAPIRGLRLAEALAPAVGTIVETHPRASLLFALPGLQQAVCRYKRADRAACAQLWQAWAATFAIRGLLEVLPHDGALDALVCATVAWLYHRRPEVLVSFAQGGFGTRGFGPLVVVGWPAQ
jgi:predicted nuclease with RNAse H fold